MARLLDTHTLLWWLGRKTKLTPAAADAIRSGQPTFVSAASVWEIAIKYALGKLSVPPEFVADMARGVADEGFAALPITLAHGQLAGSLPLLHADPFGRMLIAQAAAEGLTLVSNERAFDACGVPRLW